MKNTHCVYHLHLGSGVEDGYVGVSKNLRRRLYEHSASGLFKDETSVDILKIGTEEDCLALEASLRPAPNLGWNRAEGGWNKCTGSIGEGTRIREGERLSPATEFQNGQTPHNVGATTYRLVSPSGTVHIVKNLTVFCAENNLTRENIRKVARGNRKHHKQWTATIV